MRTYGEILEASENEEYEKYERCPQCNGVRSIADPTRYPSAIFIDCPRCKGTGNVKVMNGYMTTYTGRQFHFANPVTEEIHIEDIAHQLSMLCRWNGACRRFYSVAQHCVLVSNLVDQNSPTMMKWGLMHDAAEAYIGDVSHPVKVLIPEFKILELRIMRIIAEKFGLTWPEPPALKDFDNLALKIEASEVMPRGLALHDGYGNPIVIKEEKHLIKAYTLPWASDTAEGMFLKQYSTLFNC